MPSEVVVFGSFAALCMVISILSRDDDFFYSLLTTWVMGIFWGLNVTLWVNNSIEYFTLVDLCFTIGSLILFLRSKKIWIAILSAMFACNFILDILLLRKAIEYYGFAMASNTLFMTELVVACHPGLLTIVRAIWAQPYRWPKVIASLGALGYVIYRFYELGTDGYANFVFGLFQGQ